MGSWERLIVGAPNSHKVVLTLEQEELSGNDRGHVRCDARLGSNLQRNSCLPEVRAGNSLEEI
jgi:hypothetical protein